MSKHRNPIVLAALVAIAMPLFAGAPRAQSPAPGPGPDIRRTERFAGSVKVAGKDVRVAIDTWMIPNATKIDAFALPVRGKTIVEVRGGNIVAIIEGARAQRRAGDFWTVAASGKLQLETENDSAVIQTTVVAD